MKCIVNAVLLVLDHHWGNQRFQSHWRYCNRLRWAPAICMSVENGKWIQILASIRNKMYFYLKIYLYEILAQRISQSSFIFFSKVKEAFRGHTSKESCIITIIKINLQLEANASICFFVIYLVIYLINLCYC